jgi:hypothetical protein
MQRYVSNELTHFVGGKIKSSEEKYLLLIEILNKGFLSHPPHKSNVSGNLEVNVRYDFDSMYNPQVVCFCDIPVEDFYIHMNKYSSFGLSFKKSFLVEKGVNPVFYIAKDSTISSFKKPTQKISRYEHFNKMLKKYHSLLSVLYDKCDHTDSKELNELMDIQRFFGFHIFSFIKCFDSTKTESHLENYYMEREWRMLGNLSFTKNDVCRILVPEKYAVRIRADIPDYIGQLTFTDL